MVHNKCINGTKLILSLDFCALKGNIFSGLAYNLGMISLANCVPDRAVRLTSPLLFGKEDLGFSQ